MIIKSYRNRTPRMAPTVRAAENAVVIGAVTCADRVSLWYDVILRGDTDQITIGENCNLQEGVIVHCDHGYPVHLGSDCVIGHGAVLHGCIVGSGTMIGMGATLLSGAKVGKSCIIGAGALVTGGTVIPDRSLVMGIPAKILRSVTDQEAQNILDDCREYIHLAREELEQPGRLRPTPL